MRILLVIGILQLLLFRNNILKSHLFFEPKNLLNELAKFFKTSLAVFKKNDEEYSDKGHSCIYYASASS